MKKLTYILTIVISICFLSTSYSTAGVIGIPSGPTEQGDWFVGFAFENGKKDIKGKEYGDNVGETESDRFMGTVTYMISDNIAVFGKIGSCEIYSDDAQVFINPGFGVDPAPIFGGGIRVGLYHTEAIKIGLMVQGLYYESEQYETVSSGVWEATFEMSMIEYNAALTCSFHQFEKFIPYAGIQCVITDGEIDLEHNSTGSYWPDFKINDDFEDKDALGFFWGGEYRFNEHVSLSFEGYLVNVTGIGLGLIYHF